jgi:hypothetical protein
VAVTELTVVGTVNVWVAPVDRKESVQVPAAQTGTGGDAAAGPAVPIVATVAPATMTKLANNAIRRRRRAPKARMTRSLRTLMTPHGFGGCAGHHPTLAPHPSRA